MIRTMIVTQQQKIEKDVPLSRLSDEDVAWYWVDFDVPEKHESQLLEKHFHFHHLAIEDCFHLLQRPKLDHYDNMHFFVIHALNQQTLAAEEVNIFLTSRSVVTYHMQKHQELDDAWQKISETPDMATRGPLFTTYLVMDKLVDQYFPAVYQIEDQLNDLDSNDTRLSVDRLMNRVFDIRSKLLKIRRTIIPMRELLYRILNSQRIGGMKDMLIFYTDIYDHLLKLSEMLDSNREITADMRDSYISLNGNRMNTIMKTLTVITTIFMPLTFIAGVYGMNFRNMPELHWHLGYFAVLAVMALIGLGMYTWFRRKGWFD